MGKRAVVMAMTDPKHPDCRALCRLRLKGLVVAVTLAISLGGVAADEHVPIPEPRPGQPGDMTTPAPDATRVPQDRPAQADDPADAADAKESLDPQDVPKPLSRPAQPLLSGGKDDTVVKIETSNMPLPRPAMIPAEEAACRVRLKALSVAFEERPQLADAAGCSVPWPVAVTTLSADVKLAPEAVMNCATAERAAVFLKEHVAPKATSILGSEIATIRQDSAYVCRPRNGTKRLSEHAFGNALDIGAFILKDGRTIAVGGATKRPEGEFMLAVRLAACGPFTTVLGPGSDADHATHFHLDLAERRPGSTFCQ